MPNSTSIAIPAAGNPVSPANGLKMTSPSLSGAPAAGSAVAATTAPASDAAASAKLSEYGGREPFLYAGLALMVITVAILRPLLRRRPDLKVRLGLPYLLTLGLVAYGIEGSIPQAVAIIAACLTIVFGMTLVRMMRWRVPTRPQIQQASAQAFAADPFVAESAAKLKDLGFEPLAGYRSSLPNGVLELVAYRHAKEPVVAQVRILRLGARRYPHLAFASRLRGEGQLWTWNLPVLPPPLPSDWQTYQHAAVAEPKALFDLHKQHMAARHAKYVADSAEDLAKRLQVMGAAELQAQVARGWLLPEGKDHFRLAPKAVAKWSATAILAFLGIPLGPKRLVKV